MKSPHYIDGFYSHSFSFFFCFVGTDNSTVTTISIFGWEHILIEARAAAANTHTQKGTQENEKIHSIGNKGKYKNYLILKL